MARPALIALAAAAALAGAGCAKSACQTLGEKLCNCQPGMSQDTCTSQVQNQLDTLGVETAGFNGMLDNAAAGQPVTFEDFCRQRLDECNAAEAASQTTDFCSFLLTQGGQDACGLTPKNPPPGQ